jgi:hypothetical protein
VKYSVWAGGRTIRGSAKSILEDIQRHARPDSEVARRTVDDYADTLIKDAAYFFPDGHIPWFLTSREYSSKYEQALEYLAAMPSSGLRILSAD